MPKTPATTRPTLHMIGNGHIDPVWLWPWPEGFHEVTATFRSALDRLAESDDFVFTAGSAAMYQWIERQRPEMFAAIRQRVDEGRWVIVGGWWIQPDCNLPSGESFVRQALYGQRYFQEKFGRMATVGYNVDSFGHNAMLPQLLRKSGMDSYVFMRPQRHEMGLPSRVFHWEGPDGSRVLAFRIPFGYNASRGLPTHVARTAAEVEPPVTETMCFYGVGNHGGGPTKASIAWIHEAQQDDTGPELLFSSPDRFFADVRAHDWSLPTVHGELQHHAKGAYAAHSGVKRWNREAEHLLGVAETWTAVAHAAQGREVPVCDFTHAWEQVLFNQFHDILAGTSLASAYEDVRDTYGEAKAIAKRLLHGALQSFSWAIDIPLAEETLPVVVFNPHPWPVQTGIEVECAGLPEHPGLIDELGEPVALQLIQPEATVSHGSRNRFCFVADLPPLGYRTYRVVPLGEGAAEPDAGELTSDEETFTIENARLRLRIDAATGTIAELHDKELDVEVTGGPAARPVVIADSSDTWSHDVLSFDDERGAFAPVRVQLIERGPVRASIRVESVFQRFTVTQTFTLHAGDALRVDVGVEVDWREHHTMLKLAFPVNLDISRATYEIPYGFLARAADGEEQPGQRWLDLSGPLWRKGDLYGLTLINDAKASYSATRREMRLTVLRSPIAAHHDPRVPEPEGHFVWLDQGQQSLRYALLPHAGSWRESEATRRAAELCAPPHVVLETFHPGPLPQAQSFVSIDEGSVALGALKRAEDGHATILRLAETDGATTRAKISLRPWNRTIEADFTPSEIKTFLIPDDENEDVREVDLIELAVK